MQVAVFGFGVLGWAASSFSRMNSSVFHCSQVGAVVLRNPPNACSGVLLTFWRLSDDLINKSGLINCGFTRLLDAFARMANRRVFKISQHREGRSSSLRVEERHATT